jgi:hypothetical protein
MDASLVHNLANTLKKPKLPIAQYQRAAKTLGDVAIIENDEIKKAIQKESSLIIPKLVRLLRTPENGVASDAARAIARIQWHDDTMKMRVAKSGGSIRNLVELIDNCVMIRDFSTVEWAVIALVNVFAIEENCRVNIGDEMIEILVTLLVFPECTIQVIQAAAAAISNLAYSSRHIRTLIVDMNAVAYLVNLINKHTNIGVLQHSAGALANLTLDKDPDVAKKILSSCVPALNRMKSSCSPEVRANVAEIFQHIGTF